MNFLLIGFFVSLAFAGLNYIASENVISSLVIFLTSIGFFVFIARRQKNKYQNKTRRYHQCYRFVNTYLVSLSIKGSLAYARESAYNISDSKVKEVMDSIKEMDEEEQLFYLSKYFKFDLYYLFVDTVTLWNEQGGDILNMSQRLINKLRLKEEYLLSCESMHKSRVIEFTILWSITLIILASLRFALSQFYNKVIQTPFYQVSVVAIFLFVLLSIYILVKRISNVTLEGWKDNEK